MVSVICIWLMLSLFPSSALSRAQAIDSLQWGAATEGLQMSISTAGSNKADVPEFQVAFRNVGEQDVTLNLGIMLANGKVQLPKSIGLSLSEASGKTWNLNFFDRRYPAINGRVDDYVVPLRAGSIYTFKINLDQYWSPDTKQFGLKLPPGKCQITAQFDGTGAKTSNLDMPGIKLMNFWTGKLQSNVVEIER